MKKILSLLLILLILPVASASLAEFMQPRVDELNQQIDQEQISKASIVLPADIEFVVEDTDEVVVLQITEEGTLVLLDSIKKADVTVRGTEDNLKYFNRENMTLGEIAEGIEDLTLEGNTFKGRLALKILKEMIEKQMEELGADVELDVSIPKEEGFFGKIGRWLTAPIIGIVGWFI